MRSLAYGARLKHWARGSRVSEYGYPGGTHSVSGIRVLSLSSGGSGGVPGLSGAGRGAGAPVHLRLQRVCEFFAVPLWRGGQLSISFSQTISGSHSIADFTLLCPGNTTPHCFPSQTLARGSFISSCISSTAARKNSCLAILAISKARCMLDCSSCTRPPCLAIVAVMLKTYKKLVAASQVRFSYYLNHIWLHSLL